MQASQHEGNGRASEPSTCRSIGFHVHPDEVTLHMPGWPAVVGKGRGLVQGEMEVGFLLSEGQERSFTWQRFDFDSIEFSAAAQQLQLQGMGLPRFFVASRLEIYGKFLDPPFFLLSYTMNPPWRTPCVLEQVTLGKINLTPEDVSLDDIYKAMITSFLNKA